MSGLYSGKNSVSHTAAPFMSCSNLHIHSCPLSLCLQLQQGRKLIVNTGRPNDMQGGQERCQANICVNIYAQYQRVVSVM